jgi:membrane protein
MPQGQEFAGLLRVLGHFVTAHREGRGLHSKELLAAEPYLTDDLLQRYLGDLNRLHIAQRTEVGEWVLSRDPAATRLVELYEEGGYRLPLTPQPLPGAERTSDLLVRLGEAVRDRLDVTLSEYFPAIDKPDPRSADTAAPPTRPPGDPT